MTNQSFRRILFSALALAALVSLAPRPVAAGVYDTVAAWWHFDYDPDTDNMADLDEIRDQRDWGTTTTKGPTGKHATAIRGQSGGPRWTNSAAFRPAGGQEYGGKSISFQTAVDPATSNCWPDTFLVSNLGLAGSATLVTRFRWDGYPTELEKMSWLYNNGLEWNAYRGWLFGVQSNGFPRLTLYTQRTTVTMDVPMTNGVWYDVALVLTDGNAASITNDTVEFYLWPQGGALSYRKYTVYNTITNSIGALGTTVGCEAAPTGFLNGNARKSFIGALNHLAVWNRALSFSEVNEAFGNPQPLFQVGMNNGSPMDMRPESETDADFNLGDPWHTMRRAVTSGSRDANLKIPLTSLQSRLPYLVHVDTGTDGQPAELSLIVNGVTNETQRASNGGQLFWYVTTNLLVSGTNTFTLHYVAGPSPYISFDWLEVGGSWQVGLDNNSQAEFTIESGAPDDYFVTDPNWMHLERAVVQGSDTNTVLHFALSPELVAKSRYVYSTRVISQGRNTGTLPEPPFPFSIGVNGRILLQSAGVPDTTLIRIPFVRGDLQAGDNTINLMFNSPNGWLQFDFHRLEALPWPKGTLVMLK